MNFKNLGQNLEQTFLPHKNSIFKNGLLGTIFSCASPTFGMIGLIFAAFADGYRTLVIVLPMLAAAILGIIFSAKCTSEAKTEAGKGIIFKPIELTGKILGTVGKIVGIILAAVYAMIILAAIL